MAGAAAVAPSASVGAMPSRPVAGDTPRAERACTKASSACGGTEKGNGRDEPPGEMARLRDARIRSAGGERVTRATTTSVATACRGSTNRFCPAADRISASVNCEGRGLRGACSNAKASDEANTNSGALRLKRLAEPELGAPRSAAAARIAATSTRKQSLFPTFCTQNDHFTKTGSGQT